MSTVRYLSILTVKESLLHDSQKVHRTLMHVLGQRELWGAPDARTLVVQHPGLVNWVAALPGQVTQAISRPLETPGTDTTITWSLIANPTHTPRKANSGPRGKIRALPPEKWNSWLERKLGEALDIHTIDGMAMGTATGLKPGMRTKHRRALFHGTARVKDATKLHTLMRNGVGRGKAYGCGLLITQEMDME